MRSRSRASVLRRLTGAKPSEIRRSAAPREFISICGFSAVGKKTLIQKLLDGELRERFGLVGTVEAYGYAFQPEEQIFEATAQHVLNQWQFLNDGLIEDLTARFPASRHRAIVIWRPWEEHLRDWVAAYGAQATGEPGVATISDWWTEVIVPRFQHQLPELGIPVELVDGSTPAYDRIDWLTVERLLDAIVRRP